MVPVFTSFLPPTHTHLYLPFLFKLWEAFNSSVIDDRLIELAGNISEEHVAGPYGDAGEQGGATWKYVGLWTEGEWNLLMSKGLGSMSNFTTYLMHCVVLIFANRCSRRCHESKYIVPPIVAPANCSV